MARDAQVTRNAITAAARAEFAAFGLAGARIDRIAARAGCNKERIYAGFGDKEQLHQRVMAEMLEELRLATVVETDEDVGDYVRKSFDFYQANPALVRMLLWEALETTGDEAVDEEARRSCYRKSHAALAGQLSHAPDAKSARFLLSLIGLSVWPHAFGTLARLITDDDTSTEDGQKQLREFLADFAAQASAVVDK